MRIASEERERFLKSLKAAPPEFRERIVGVTVRFDECPSREMLERGVAAEALSLALRDQNTIVLFLMTLYEQYGRFPGDFRRELRRVMCQELADWAGMEWMGEDST